jgi:hypothetical protein
MPDISPEPSPGRVVRTLQDGFWDLTEVIELCDGTRRVRKRSKGATAERPWGPESLRREIRYLQSASPKAAEVLPCLLACWDYRSASGGIEVGYEMPFYPDHRDAGTLAKAGVLDQDEIDIFQGELADAVFERLHEPASLGPERELLSRHMTGAVRQALDGLAREPAFAALVEAELIELNGRRVLGPRAAFEKILGETDIFNVIDRTPAVRLHGDLHLENILWRPLAIAGRERGLILIDVVSVAGVTFGPPVWDLVKYESYATGELMALRAEQIEVGGLGDPAGHYRCRVRTESQMLAPFLSLNWHALFREAFVSQYGCVDERAYRVIHGYFNAAMALNTTGVQRQGRLLRATEDFNAVLAVG